MFREVMTPIIENLHNKFNIILIVVDFHIDDELRNEFRDLKNNNIIKAFFIIPPYTMIKEQYKFLKDNTKLLKTYDFDYWLAASEMQIDDKYISKFIVPKKCFVIVFVHTVTYLFERLDILNMLFDDKILLENNNNILQIEKVKCEDSGSGISRSLIFNKLIKFKSRYIILLAQIVKNKLIKYFKIIIHKYYYRVLLPWFIFGKTFTLESYDELTQIGSGKSDLFIFTDTLEVKAHKKLFKKDEIITAQYPSYGNCTCDGEKIRTNNVLIILGGVFMSNSVSMDIMKLFLRDSLVVFNETKPDYFHLRLHPRMNTNSPMMLKKYLEDNGIPTKISLPKKTIREIMCDYIGVAGLSSNGLRDARASCDFAFVTCFEAVSKLRYPNPKIMYGMGEGITWINEDGSYNPKIFRRKKYVPPKRKSVSEIIYELESNNNTINIL